MQNYELNASCTNMQKRKHFKLVLKKLKSDEEILEFSDYTEKHDTSSAYPCWTFFILFIFCEGKL